VMIEPQSGPKRKYNSDQVFFKAPLARALATTVQLAPLLK
jgi:hypothetical protein